MDTRHRKIDTCNIGHKTQEDRHVLHWKQDIERETWVTLDTRHKKIDTITMDTRNRKRDTGNIGHKTQKDRHG